MFQSLRGQFQRQVLASPLRQWVGPIVLTVAVGVGYFLAARLSLHLLTKPGVAVFWPAAGIASGTLIALGPDARWPVAVGVIAANTVANLMGDRNVLSSSVFALSDAGEGLFVAWMIERYIGSDFRLGRLRHVVGLLVATVVGTAVSGVGGTVGYELVHSPNEPAWITWQQWVASDSIGIITVAPLIIGLLAALRAPPPRRELIEGAAAFVAVVTVTALIILLLPKDLWDDRVPILLLFPLLLWPAARCRPVFASAASFAVCLMFMLAIIFDIGYFNGTSSSSALVLGGQVRIVVAALFALVLAALFAERRRTEGHQKVLMAELDHRVKNLLARVLVVADSARQGSSSADEFARSLNGRLRSMAAAHDLLSQSSWQNVCLRELVRNQLAPYSTDANMTISGADVTLTPAATEAIAMVLHELVTNAAKHGALSTPDGRVSISWDRKANGAVASMLRFEWRELGGPPVASSIRPNYGTDLIRDLIPHELGGNVDLVFAPDGAYCSIEIPLGQR